MKRCSTQSITYLQDSDKEDQKVKFRQLVDDVNWFFFDFFILGYVEISGQSVPSWNYSLCLPTSISTSVYIEVMSTCMY